MKPSSPTLRDVAHKAGVSAMTVSLALRNQSSIAASTRHRIQALAAEMGYRRDPVMARLMAQLPRSRRGHSPVLAYVTDHPEPLDQLGGQVDASSLRGAVQRAYELGYHLEEFQLTGKMTAARLCKILRGRGIEGVIIGPLRKAGTKLALDWHHFACIAIGYSLSDPHLNRVCNNQFQSMLKAMRRLHGLGYRRVGLVMDRDNDRRVNHVWKAGYQVACSSMKWSRTLPPLIYDDAFESRFLTWYERRQPDVILGAIPGSWRDVLGLLRARCDSASLHLWPGDTDISGINQNWQRLGAVAVDLLIAGIHTGQFGIPDYPITTEGEGFWVDGTTTRKAKPIAP